MNKIHISRNREILGQFSPEEVREGFKTGRFLPADLAWRQGMTEWKPLGTLPELIGEEDTPELPPMPAAPSGTPDQPALSAGEVMPSWERRADLGVVPAIIETTKEVLARPSETFAAMPKTGGIGGSLLYSIAVAWVTTAVAFGYQGLWAYLNPEEFQKQLESMGQASVELGFFWMIMGVVIVFLPLFLAIGLFVSAGVVHLGLMVFGGARNGFEATLRVLAYTQGATSVLQLIPMCGGLLYSVWYFVSGVIGLIKVHEADPWRVILAVLLPFLLCCGLIFFFIAAAGAAALGGAAAGG